MAAARYLARVLGVMQMVASIQSSAGSGDAGKIPSLNANGFVDSSMMPYADSETPSGTADGLNATFTLANAPSPALSLQLYVNGLLMDQGVGKDYTLSGAIITFTGAPPSGSKLRAWYRY